MLLAIKIKLSFHKEMDFFFYCWLLGWFISSLGTNFTSLPPHKNALMSGEEGESGCWQQSHPLCSFIYLFRHVVGKSSGIPVANPRTSRPPVPSCRTAGTRGLLRAPAGGLRERFVHLRL